MVHYSTVVKRSSKNCDKSLIDRHKAHRPISTRRPISARPDKIMYRSATVSTFPKILAYNCSGNKQQQLLPTNTKDTISCQN